MEPYPSYDELANQAYSRDYNYDLTSQSNWPPYWYHDPYQILLQQLEEQREHNRKVRNFAWWAVFFLLLAGFIFLMNRLGHDMDTGKI